MSPIIHHALPICATLYAFPVSLDTLPRYLVPAQIPKYIPTPQRQAHTNTYEERSPQSTLAALRTLGAAELNALAIPEPSVSSVWHRPWSPVPGEETVKEMTEGSVSFHSGMGESLGVGKDLRSGGPLSLRWETLTKEGMVYSVI